MTIESRSRRLEVRQTSISCLPINPSNLQLVGSGRLVNLSHSRRKQRSYFEAYLNSKHREILQLLHNNPHNLPSLNRVPHQPSFSCRCGENFRIESSQRVRLEVAANARGAASGDHNVHTSLLAEGDSAIDGGFILSARLLKNTVGVMIAYPGHPQGSNQNGCKRQRH